jgi:isopentenyl diphosphate isomerase/L-lactate dehydrogenase-like FMN-dependent dehydrogenase
MNKIRKGDEVVVIAGREAEGEQVVAIVVEAEITLELLPRVLVDVSDRTLETRCLDTDLSMPVAVAPTAFHRLAHEQGEIATARGAAAAGTPDGGLHGLVRHAGSPSAFDHERGLSLAGRP